MGQKRRIFRLAIGCALAGCAGATGDNTGSSPAACGTAAQGQPWQQSVGSIAGSVSRDPTGGVLVLAGQPGKVTKLSDEGSAIWTADVAGNAGALAALSDGGGVAATVVPGTEPVDPQIRRNGPRGLAGLSRLDKNGRPLWQATVSDDMGDLLPRFVGVASDGDFLIGGQFQPDIPATAFANPPFVDAGFIARVSASGQPVWERHLVNPGAVRGFVVDGDGRLGVIFWVQQAASIDQVALQPNHDGWAGFLVWFDAAGNAVGAFDITEDSEERYSSVVRDAAGRLYVSGNTLHEMLGSATKTNFLLTGYSAAGDRLWGLSFGDQGDDSSLAVDDCGDVLFAGNGGLGGSRGIVAARVGADGQIKNQIVVPSTLADYAAAMGAAPGGIFLSGARDNNQTPVVARLGL